MSHTTSSETIADNIYKQIREDIISCRLPSEHKLRLDKLKDHYSVSVSTLREILSRLSSEGLVSAEGQRGFEVAPMSESNLNEVADVRTLLETHALAVSLKNGGIDWEAELVSAHHKLTRTELMLKAGEDGRIDEWRKYEREFHRALIAACGSQLLMDTHAGVFDKYLRYQLAARSFSSEISVNDHLQLMNAAINRDYDTASKILKQHIQTGMTDILARWPFADN